MTIQCIYIPKVKISHNSIPKDHLHEEKYYSSNEYIINICPVYSRQSVELLKVGGVVLYLVSHNIHCV